MQQTTPESGARFFRLAMLWLDDLLCRAVNRHRQSVGSEAGRDPFRGLHISNEEIDRLLQTEPPSVVRESEQGELFSAVVQLSHTDRRLSWFVQQHELDPFDLQVFLVALSPEIDPKYESIYAFLQDNVTARQPRVDLVLKLLCDDADQRLCVLRRFAPGAPLCRHQLLHLHADPQRSHSPMLARTLSVADQIRDWWLSFPGLDRRLELVANLSIPRTSIEQLPFKDSFKAGLRALLEETEAGQGLRLLLRGRRIGVADRVAEACAGSLRMPLLRTSLKTGLDASLIGTLVREAWLQGALLLIEDWDFTGHAPESVRRWLEAVQNCHGPVVLIGTRSGTESESSLDNLLTLPLPALEASERQTVWRTELVAQDLTVDEQVLDELSHCYRLSPAQIERTVRSVRSHAIFRRGAEGGAGLIETQDWFAAVRAQCGHELAQLAQRVVPAARWEHLILPADAIAQLRELCQRVRGQYRVLRDWGFAARLSYGKGVTALFSGPSGTGKTMAAEVVAHQLGLDLYRIELASIVSKWLGETEKNLDQVFDAAESANAVLFFDEADALFGRRSEVSDARDRYANLEISYLLQKMESFEGATILATNLRQNLDEAFVRRLTFNVVFPFPDEADRQRIWRAIWPPRAPLSDDVDLDGLARQYRFTGGNIKNIALAAAFLAADEETPIQQRHLLHAIQREYQKMGKSPATPDHIGLHKEVLV